jgi:hypothetical protein
LTLNEALIAKLALTGRMPVEQRIIEHSALAVLIETFSS